MIAYLFIGILLAVGLFVLLNWWSKAEVRSAKNAIFWAIIAVCAVLGLILYSRAGFVGALLPGAFALWRMVGFVRSAASIAGKMGGSGNSTRKSGQMTQDEALEVLGLEVSATEADINSAYKRLMSQCHPDKGGSDWMASQLNEAKRVLLKK